MLRLGWLLLLIGWVAACKPSLKETKKKIIYNGPIAQTRDVVTLYSDSARLQIKLTAPLQLQYETGDGIYPDGINMTFYDKKGAVTNTVRDNYGKYEKQKDSYFIRGNVVLNNAQDSETMKTEELYWDKNRKRIHTDKFVTIQTKDEILKGHGMEANQDFSDYRILKPSGVFSVK